MYELISNKQTCRYVLYIHIRMVERVGFKLGGRARQARRPIVKVITFSSPILLYIYFQYSVYLVY